MNADVAFVEQTIFMIFLWAGVWGVMEHCLLSISTNMRLVIYCTLIVVSCAFLYVRGHTKKLASL